MLLNVFSTSLKAFTYGIGSTGILSNYTAYLMYLLSYLLNFYYKKTISILLFTRRHLFHLVTVSP